MSDQGTTEIAAAATLTLSSDPSGRVRYLQDGRTLRNAGTVVWNGHNGITVPRGEAYIHNQPAGLFEIHGAGILDGLPPIVYDSPSSLFFTNEGIVREEKGTQLIFA